MGGKFFLAVCFFVVSLFGITLENAVKDVLSTNPTIQTKIKYFRAVKQDVGIAKSGYYPKIDLVAGIGEEKTKNRSTNYDSVSLSREELGIVLRENLFEGFGTYHQVNKELYRVDSAAFSVIEQANKTSLDMIEAYINILKQKELLHLAEKKVETYKKITGKIQERIDSGVGTESEIQQSKSRLSLAHSNYVVQMNNYEDTISSFIKLYGKYISPEELEEPNLVKDLPKSKEEILKQAKLFNPSLNVQRSNIKVAKSNLSLSEKNFYPTVDLELRQDWNSDIGGVEGDDDSASVMLRLRYNLYNGNADSANRQKSISELRKEIASYHDLQRRVDESVRLAWMAYTTLEKQMVYLKEHKSLSEKTLELYIEEFNLGRRTLLDILDTEEELYSANRELVTAKYDHIFAGYRILESIGTLSNYVDPSFASVVGLANGVKSKADELDSLPKD